MVEVKMVVMREKSEEVAVMEVYVCGGVDVEDGEVVAVIVTRIVARMIIRDIARVEGAGPRLRVVAGLGEDGVGIVRWKDLLVVVVLEKVKEMA